MPSSIVKYPVLDGLRAVGGGGATGVPGYQGKASDYSIRRDRAGGLSGLNPGPPSTDASGTVQGDVATDCNGPVEIGLGQ